MSHAASPHNAADCLPAAILGEVARGRVPEPLLDIYLKHLESCDACCAAIERNAALPRKPELHFAPHDTGVGLDAWLHGMKAGPAPGGLESPAETETDPEFGGRIGTRIGPFLVTAMLGMGGSSVVYEARDEELDRAVVLKVLRTVHARSAQQHQAVVAEARALAALQHDAVMPLLQLLWHDESPVLVFPRLAGETLADALAAGTCPPHAALAAMRDVARALAHTHAVGIFHHDIKPSNIWLRRRPADGQISALLFDFGLAGSSHLMAGTPGYSDPAATPETSPQARDIFSLGVVLHECIANATHLPPEAHGLARRLTAADPSLRPEAAEIVTAIDRLLAPRWIASRRWAVSAAVAAGIAAAAAWVALVGREPAAPAHTVDVSNHALEADAGPLKPVSVIPGAGLPLAISGDARLQCTVVDGPAVKIRDLRAEGSPISIPLHFRPELLAFNVEAHRLAAADTAGHVAIIDVPSATVSYTQRFNGGVQWMGWSGWKRDVLVVVSDTEAHAICKTFKKGQDAADWPDWKLLPLRGDIQAIATLPGTEGVVSASSDGQLTVWSVGNFVEDIVLQLPPLRVTGSGLAERIGWKTAGVCFVARDKTILEHAPLHGPLAYKVAAPVQSIVWPTDTEHVVLTDDSAGRSRIFMGDRLRPDWHRDFDLGGEDVVDLRLLDDRRRVLAITPTGGGRIYNVRP